MSYALNGREIQKTHLQIDWQADHTDLTWEPLTQIYRDQPDLVRSYFKQRGLNLNSVLAEDSKRCEPTQTNNSKGKPQRSKHPDHLSSQHRVTSMTSEERNKQKRMKRFQEEDRKLAEQNKAKQFSVSSVVFNGKIKTQPQLGFNIPFGCEEESRQTTASEQPWQLPFSDVTQPVEPSHTAVTEPENLWAKKKEPQLPEASLNSVNDFKKLQKKMQQPVKVAEKEQPDRTFADFVNSQFAQIDAQMSTDVDFVQECRLAQEQALPQFLGNIIEHAPKQVLAVAKCPRGTGLLYLCCWHQNFEGQYLVPSWVQSEFLTEIVGQRLVVDFFEKQIQASLPNLF